MFENAILRLTLLYTICAGLWVHYLVFLCGHRLPLAFTKAKAGHCTAAHPTHQIFYLIWRESLKAEKSQVGIKKVFILASRKLLVAHFNI